MEPSKERKLEDIENPTVREWVRDYITRKWAEADDPVQQKVGATTAKDFVAWLVWYKNLPEECAENVESNFRELYCRHRLQGRLDNIPDRKSVV